MKKTLIALFALSGMAMAADTLTLYDQWTFDKNLASTHNRTFIAQNASASFSGGAMQLTLNNGAVSGIHLNDSNTLDLDSNWALQLTCTIPVGNSSKTAQVLTCLNNVDGGTQLAIANQGDGGVYGFAGTQNWAGWGANNRANTVAAINTPMVLTLMNYNGDLYLAQNDGWATFGNGTDHVSDSQVGDMKLRKLTLGFGRNGTNGLAAQTITVDNLSVYTFDPEKVQVAQVKSALMSNVPEPTTGSLSLLALAGLCARRRKK